MSLPKSLGVLPLKDLHVKGITVGQTHHEEWFFTENSILADQGMTRQNYCTNRAQAHCEVAVPPSSTRKAPSLWILVESYLTEQQWSPEEISGYLKKNTEHRVSHEAIYLHIYQDKDRGGLLYKELRQGHRKRRRRKNTKDRRGMIKGRVGIENRPEIVEDPPDLEI